MRWNSSRRVERRNGRPGRPIPSALRGRACRSATSTTCKKISWAPRAAAAELRRRMDPTGIRVRLLTSAATIAGGSAQFHLRQVNARLAFVRGVVADPEEPFMKDKAGVTGVAAGRQLEALGEFAGAGINP